MTSLNITYSLNIIYAEIKQHETGGIQGLDGILMLHAVA
jgi:hypothetical protein